jgi:hypothetical protein
MRKRIIKSLCLSLALLISLLAGTTALAAPLSSELNQITFDSFGEDLTGMTNDELNVLIDNIAEACTASLLTSENATFLLL